jgi:transcriptional regulator with XRE-family HTH domain
LTQEEIAERVGVTPQAVSNWEVGRARPLGSSRILIAQLFDVSVDIVDSWFDNPSGAAA